MEAVDTIPQENKAVYEKKLKNIDQFVQENAHLIDCFSVQSGWLGLSLFKCLMAKYTQDEKHYSIAEEYLDKAISISSPKYYKRKYPTDSYDYDLAQMGIYFFYGKKNGFFDFDIDGFLTDIKEILLQLGGSKVSVGDFSQFSGALASARFFIETGDCDNKVLNFYRHLVEGVENKAKVDGNGNLFWQSPCLYNRVYLGSSHGSAMIISFLAALYDKGIEEKRSKEIIRRATNFVIRQKQDVKRGIYPNIVGEKPEPTQFSQCYGDLGVGYGLLRAGQVLQDENILQEAMYVLESCSHRKREDGLTGDASMTYGAAGLAQYFDKIARTTDNNPQFIQASKYWYRQIPHYAQATDNGFAGFKPMIESQPLHVYLSYGWGIAGIGIALMRYLQPDLPNTDCFNKYI